jgi:hypothetical protein
MKIPIALFIAILSLAISAGTMVYSVRETRSEIHLDPELERLALGFLKEEERRREEDRKVDAETHRVEQNLVIPMPSQSKEFDALPKLWPTTKSK